jgi:Tol biopolymer transport system component
VAAGVLSVAAAAGGVGATPAEAATTTLTVPSAIAGERVTATGKVADAKVARTVRLQKRVSGTWRTVATGRTTSRGAFRLALTQPSGPTTYRAQASAVRRKPSSTTPSRTVRPVVQKLSVAAPASAATDTSVETTVRFSPVRAGRPFVVERKDDLGWTVVARGAQDGRGTARPRIAVGAAGDREIRVTASVHRGAVVARASTRVRVEETTGSPPATPELVSTRADGRSSAAPSHLASSDRTGRWVAFTSSASDLGVSNPEGRDAVWLRDTVRGTTSLVSRTRGGAIPDGDSTEPSISADGRFVVYSSRASDLVTDDHDGHEPDVFLFDRTTSVTSLVSRRSVRAPEDSGRSFAPSISANGRWITYSSDDLGVTGTTGLPWLQVMLHDRVDGGTALVSTGPDGPGDGVSLGSRVSDDGLVAFRSSAPRLTGRASNEVADLFLHSPGRSGLRNVTRQGNAGSSSGFDLSADGSRLVFQSQSWNLPGAGDDDDLPDVFLLEAGIIRLVSTSDQPATEHRYPSISDDGGTVTWLALHDPEDGDRTLQVRASDLRPGTERAVTTLPGGSSTVWPLDLSGDGRVSLVRTRRADLTGDDTTLVDQVVRLAVPR